MKFYTLAVLALFVFVFVAPSASIGQETKPKTEDVKPEKTDDKQSDDKQSDDEKKDDEKSSSKKKSDDKKKSNDKKKSDEKSDDKEADGKKKSSESQDDDKSDDSEDDSEDSGDADSGTAKKSPLSNLFGNTPARRDDEFSKRSKDFVAVFEPVVASASTSTVKIMAGRRQVALGVVVDTEGFVLTKASELKGDLSVKFADGRQASAKVYGIHPESDLALLQVQIDNLNLVQWSEGNTPVVGQWLVTPNLKTSKLEVGVVGVDARIIPPSDPFIGIYMDDLDEKAGVKVIRVQARSPAEDADLLVGDIITKIDDIPTDDIASLRKTLTQYDPNTRVTLTIFRAGKPKKIKLTLAERDKISPANDRSNQQNSMGSVPSRRRKNFPLAFQHDSMLTAATCGGPVVNLDGQVVGINIARAGRVASLSLPVETVLPIVALLKTGDLAPEVVNKEKLVEIDSELEELNTKLGHLPDRENALEKKFAIEQARQEELEKVLKDVQDRLNVIELKTNNFRQELESVQRDLKNIEKIRQRLEADRKQLATGIR